MPKFTRHPKLLSKDNTVVVVVDYQEKMVAAMQRREDVTKEMIKVLQAANDLGVPIMATEQYPSGLGPTIPEIKQLIPDDKIAEKMTFSCCGIDTFADMLMATQRKQVVLMGIECHVCVIQTALDLVANGYQVHLPQGATCSRNDANRDNALERMKQEGVILTNAESVIFELLYEAGTDDFKKVRKLIV